MKIVLLSCVKTKKDLACKAKYLYNSPWFHSAFQYAQSQKPDRIFILSARHRLVDQDQVIAPYEETLNTKTCRELRLWAEEVLALLRHEADLQNDSFIILAGERYRKYLVPHLAHHEVPMAGLRSGQQLQWMKARRTS